MSQADLGALDPNTTSGTSLASLLAAWRTALHSFHKGPSRPSYAIAGTAWINDTTTPWVLNVYDGSDDIALGTINATTNVFQPTLSVPVASKSGNYTAVAADRGKLIDFTAAATLSYTAAATLGDGWWCAVRVSGAGVTVTHDPNSTEQIDGQGTIVQGQGEAFLVVCDASGFKTIGRRPDDPWTDLASATTTDLGSVPSRHIRITGTTTITGFGTAPAGTRRTGRFAGALTLTHNATSLIIPGGASVTTAADDRFEAVSLGSGNWIVLGYVKADGTPLVSSAAGRLLAVQFLKSGTSYTRTAGCTNALIVARGGGGAGGGAAATNGSSGGGGGQGGLSIKWIAPSASETYAIGAGGTAGSAGSAGNAGGNTTFGSHVTASGGSGGAAGTSSTGGAGGAGGAASSGDLNVPGAPGEGTDYFGASGVALRGGQGGGEGAGLGAAPSAGAAGSAATANTGGGGGGGASGGTAQAGGAGGSGFIIVYEYS